MAETFTCTHCARMFDARDDLDAHVREMHAEAARTGLETRTEDEIEEEAGRPKGAP